LHRWRWNLPERIATQECEDVLQRLGMEELVCLSRDVAEVRRDDRARVPSERVLERQRLLVEDVEAGGKELAVPFRTSERTEQRRPRRSGRARY
jgi:hypothetical protein